MVMWLENGVIGRFSCDNQGNDCQKLIENWYVKLNGKFVKWLNGES